MFREGFCLSWVLLVCLAQSVCAEWDYIVVGAGASGCVVAPQLAASGKKVLILEAGGKTAWEFGGRDQSAAFGTLLDSTTVFDVPGEASLLWYTKRHWWSNARWGLFGRGIGGSGMMNAALTFVPSPSDFDSWPVGWQYTHLESSFQQTMSGMHVTSTPSADGKLYVQRAGNAFDRLATNHLGMRQVGLNDDPNDRVGTFSIPDVTAKNGKRIDSCLAFLLPALSSMDNLELRSDAEVRRILFEGEGRARGVELIGDGSEILLNAGGKLVLTAGTLQTARLLMISGVGPRSELNRLNKHGLVLNSKMYWIENDEVGKGMSDHTWSQIILRVPNSPDFSFRYVVNQNDADAGSMYLGNCTGPYAQYGPIRLGFMAKPGRSSPDVEFLVTTSGTEGAGPAKDCNTCFGFLIMNMYPKARDNFKISTPGIHCCCGENTCNTGDICKPELYQSNQEDKDIIQWALELTLSAAKSAGYEIVQPDKTDSAGISDFLATHPFGSFTASHMAGTCQLGKCTDMNLKVKGTENIYVADSSLFPAPVRAHNVATVRAVAHRAAGVIRDADEVCNLHIIYNKDSKKTP